MNEERRPLSANAVTGQLDKMLLGQRAKDSHCTLILYLMLVEGAIPLEATHR